MFRTDREFTGLQVEDLLFVNPDGCQVVDRGENPFDPRRIVEPKLSGSIDSLIWKSWKRVAGRVALDITPNILLDLRQRGKECRVLVTMVSDELVI